MTTNRGPNWRVGDAVAFEQMRQLSDLLVARLVLNDRARALAIRRQTLLVDGFDRSAIDERSRALAELLQKVLS